MYDFNGRIAIVTGGASGLGLAMATRLAVDGAAVAVFDRDEVALPNAVAAIEKTGGKAIPVVVDVSSRQEVDAAVAQVEKELGTVDILINNAGITVIKTYVEHTDDDFDRLINVNLRSTHFLMSRVLPGMIEQANGAIVNISSAAALHYTVPHAGYAASKAGVIALGRDVAFEVARHGVRVNTIAPGLIAVERSSTKVPYLASQTKGTGRPLHAPSTTRPLGHGRPEDIANVAAFLVSDQARFIIGATIPVCGGTDLQVSMAFPGEDFE
jgi:NAD(P)-dependent dehydrogenase (short-subunit alcohol dehydrogenase family)